MVKLHLSRILGERRMSQMDLSRLTGIRPGTINDWYHETVDRVNLEHLDKMCRVLECTVAELLEYRP